MSRFSENALRNPGGTSEDEEDQMSMKHSAETMSVKTPSTATEVVTAATSSGESRSPSTSAWLSNGKPGTSGEVSRKRKKKAKGRRKKRTKVSDKGKLKSFDRCYSQKGTIYVIPEAWKPKVNFYPKEKRSRSTPAPEASRDSKGKDARPKRIYQTKKPVDCYIQDEERLVKSRGNVSGEEAELLVIERTKAALEEITSPGDPPVFLLHHQTLSKRKDKTEQNRREENAQRDAEMDVLILHSSLGILILEVKAWESVKAVSPRDLNTAATQLVTAHDILQEKVGDLLEKDAFVLTIALPNLQQKDADEVRRKITRTDVTKQRSSVTSAPQTAEQASARPPASDTGTEETPGCPSLPSPPTSTPSADVTNPAATSHSSSKDGGDDREHGGKGCTKVKASRRVNLEDHPEIRLLFGSTPEVFAEWARWLQGNRDAACHAYKGTSDEERLATFKLVCERLFRHFGVSPGQCVKDGARIRNRFHLTAEQKIVRDKNSELLHVSGSPGSGKTLLLIEKAKEWIDGGRRVALATGLVNKGLLLHHLSHSICTEKTDMDKVVTHRTVKQLMSWLSTVSPDEPVSVILDEARPDTFPYSSLLEHMAAQRIQGLWSADTRPLLDQDKITLEGLGGHTAELTRCLRCPASVIKVANAVKEDIEPELRVPEHAVIREAEREVTMISHPEHHHPHTYDECPTCQGGVYSAFSSLGLPEDGDLALNDCVVITTEKSTNRQKVAKWLQDRGLGALAAKKPQTNDTDEIESWASRLLKGTDNDGNPVIHVVNWEDFQGLERPVVMVWHEDNLDVEENDEGEDNDGETDRNDWVDEYDEQGDNDDWEDEDDEEGNRWEDEDDEEEGSVGWKAEERDSENWENEEIERGNNAAHVVRQWLRDCHQDSWFHAVTRSMGHLIVFIATPTPLLPLSPIHSESLFQQ